ncbi:MAG: tryptophan--tRNA ligase [Planctomycetota bacterium]
MRVLSGLTPSAGGVHLGNYFGAIRQWIDLPTARVVDLGGQPGERVESFYFIANYHGLNSVRNREALTANTRAVALDYLALGLDPNTSTLYRQCDVPEVCELTWILSTLTPMGLLERCHAYKDKVAQGLSPDHGLFAYPVLMAADILLPRSHLVPVGQDQKQHVEVTRDIAVKFNLTYGEYFPLPNAHIVEAVAKVPGIDGRKMGKSYGNDIGVFESEQKVKQTISRIVTDSAGVEDKKEPVGNVIYELYALVAGAERTAQMAARLRAGGYGYGAAKQELNAAFLDYFAAARARRAKLEKNPADVEEILVAGAKRVRPIVEETMDRVRALTGISARMT